eukprot:CAMPEP_0197847698 /NCGR_PEP_ID=MMETSP1438-20131217/6849_1 /TAXON_ID=1461541 /ORGANISM="Pterosperma sp., Strain CCMP1384" /LENGTH=295 /DNA_ID=CAMNT_0043459699 /DNA_START=31 /DNA_END=918 /DNA_ORIENTATION=-
MLAQEAMLQARTCFQTRSTGSGPRTNNANHAVLRASLPKRGSKATLSRKSLSVSSSRDGPELWTPQSYRPVEEIAQSERAHGVESIYSGREPPSPMLQERMSSVLGSLFQKRIVRLGGAVDDDMCNLIVAQLLYLDATNPDQDITIYVNSPGGSVTAGMAVFDTMRYVKPDCSTICVGLAASMGAFLLASGAPGKRYSLPNSRIMIHQPLGGAQGQAADIEIQANEIMHHKLTLSAYLSDFTKQPLDTIIEDTDRDFFMSAEDAKSYGLVDGVIENVINTDSKKIPMYPEYVMPY